MTFNWWTFLLELLNFVVLAYVLHRLLYRPLRRAVESRRQAVTSAQAEAEQSRRDAAALQEQLQARLTEVEAERQEAIRSARVEARGERQKILDEAEQLARQRRDAARQALEQERDEALKALRGEVIAQGVEVARRLLAESADHSLQRQLALRLTDAVKKLPEAQREQLRAHWQPEDGALLETAEAPDADTLAALTEAVTAVVGSPVALAVHTRPALVAGARLRLGGHVWDSSLAAQLKDTNGAVIPEGGGGTDSRSLKDFGSLKPGEGG
jgi:F-type H+-transporting ATPase subunit b